MMSVMNVREMERGKALKLGKDFHTYISGRVVKSGIYYVIREHEIVEWICRNSGAEDVSITADGFWWLMPGMVGEGN